MATIEGLSAAARRVRFGRLDRASSRVDRARAEAAIREALGEQVEKIVWARGLVHGVELVAGRSARVPFTFRHEGGMRPGFGRMAELPADP